MFKRDQTIYPYSVSGQQLWDWYQQARQHTLEAGVPLYELDWFMQAMSNLDSLSLRLGSVQQQPSLKLRRSPAELAELWHQRLTDRVPVQYLVGFTSWRTFSLAVTPAVLIPRPETELIIDRVKAAVAQTPSLQTGHWVDLGTGSGAIALGLADALPHATIHAVDQSADAVMVAQENAKRNDMGDRIQFYIGSWFEPLQSLRGKLSGVVSNPPYIPTETVGTLEPEVMCHEPHAALDGGEDGLESLRHLVSTAPQYLVPGGFWIVELMAGQAPIVAELLAQQGQYCNIQVHQDLAGVERFVSGDRI